MVDFKGIPGPWTVKEKKNGTYFYISGPTWAAFAKVVVRMFGESSLDKRGVANAKLIAAAPELLSALRSCVMSMQAHPDCEPDSEFEGFVEKGWAAINKALGI